MSSVVSTTVSLESLRYPSDSRIDRRTSDGALYMLKRTGAGVYDTFWSQDNGNTWANVNQTLTRSDIQETSGIFIDNDGLMHLAYNVYEGGQDKIYYRTRVSGSAWGTERTIAVATAGSAGAVYTGVSVVAFKMSGVTYVFFAVGTSNGSNSGVTLFAATINSSGTFTLRNNLIDGYRQWINGPLGVVHPSIDFKHTGDGKSVGSGPAVWVAWGRGNLYCIKASWTSGPNWYGPWTPTTIVAGLSNQHYNVGRYNGYGNRFHVAYPSGDTVKVVERRVDDSGTIATRTTPAHPKGNIVAHGLSNSSNSNSYRVYAVGTTDDTLYFIDWTATGIPSWGSWTQVSATEVVGSQPNNFSIRRNNYGTGQYDLVFAGGTSPYTLTYTSSTAISAPKTPVIVSPENGSPQNVSATLLIDWTFTDDDPLDSQDAYVLRRNVNGTIRYWNQAGGTWDVAEVWNSSSQSAKVMAGGWSSAGDFNHYYSVKVRDQSGLMSGYSNDVIVVPSEKINPTITSPGATVTTSRVTVNWTVAEQSAFRVKLLQGSAVLHDSDYIDGTALAYQVPYQLVNGDSYTVQLTTKNLENLIGDTQSQAFTVAFTPPHEPTSMTLTPSTVNGGITIAIDNGTPTGGEPSFVSQDFYRRVVGTTGLGVVVATGIGNNGSHFDFTAASNTEYEYRSLIRGSNGATRYSAWYA